MEKFGWLMIGLTTLAVSNLPAAVTAEEMGEIFTNRCANCHGAAAEGVPLIKEPHGVKPAEADASGMASEEKTDIYGPPLNGLSKEEIVAKLIDLRSKGFESESYHSVMRQNLKHIEAREGDISDEMMAEYIYDTFGEGVPK